MRLDAQVRSAAVGRLVVDRGEGRKAVVQLNQKDGRWISEAAIRAGGQDSALHPHCLVVEKPAEMSLSKSQTLYFLSRSPRCIRGSIGAGSSDGL